MYGGAGDLSGSDQPGRGARCLAPSSSGLRRDVLSYQSGLEVPDRAGGSRKQAPTFQLKAIFSGFAQFLSRHLSSMRASSFCRRE